MSQGNETFCLFHNNSQLVSELDVVSIIYISIVTPKYEEADYKVYQTTRIIWIINGTGGRGCRSSV